MLSWFGWHSLFSAFVGLVFKNEPQPQHHECEDGLELVWRGENRVVDSAEPVEHLSLHHMKRRFPEDDGQKRVLQKRSQSLGVMYAVQDDSQHAERDVVST